MNRSKATAALLRLKEIDKKYKARYEDQKQEQSSDNTESLLEKAEYKINTLPSLLTEKQEILKPTLNIKIPDTCTEQLESHSTISDKDLTSLRVSIVDKTPIATPRVESQSVSEIQEEIDEVESIAEELEDFEHSDSQVTKRNHEEALEKIENKHASLAVTLKSISTDEKQSKNHESVLKAAPSRDYSNDFFNSYSSVAKNSTSTHSQKKESKSRIVLSKSNIHEGNNNVTMFNTEKAKVLSKSEGISKIEKFTESIEKGIKDVTSKDTETVDEISEELSMSVKATDSSRSKLDAKTTFKDPKISGESDIVEGTNLKINEHESQEESSYIKNENLSDSQLHKKESKRKDLEITDKRENGEKSSSTFHGTKSSREKSEKDERKHTVSKMTYELENEEESSCTKNEKSLRVMSEQERSKSKKLKNASQEKSEKSSSYFEDRNSSSAKSERDRSKPKDLGLVDDTENNEELSSSAKEVNSLRKKFVNNKTASLNSAQMTKQTSLKSLRRSKKHRRKSSDYFEGSGSVPEADTVGSESSSRRKSSRGRTENRDVTVGQREVEKEFSKTVDRSVRRLPSAMELGAAKERTNPTRMRRKNHYQSSKVYEHIKSKRNVAETTKASTIYQVNEKKYHEPTDRQLERLKIRRNNLRLEQERQLMLCCMREFEDARERHVLWPNQLYCPGKPEIAIVKPLNFSNVLNFTKPDSTSVKRDVILPDNHMTMLKDRVSEIRQWLKDQFVLYQDYSDVATAINAKYIAKAEAEKVGFMFHTFGRFFLIFYAAMYAIVCSIFVTDYLYLIVR